MIVKAFSLSLLSFCAKLLHWAVINGCSSCIRAMFQANLIMTPSFRLRFWHRRRVRWDHCEFTAMLFWRSGTGTGLGPSWALLRHLWCWRTCVRAASNITDRPSGAHGSAKTYYAIPLLLTYSTACWEDKTSSTLCVLNSLYLYIHKSLFYI